MADPSYPQVSQLIADLGSGYERYSRNRTLDEQTGQEVILPPIQNRKALEKLQQGVAELCVLYLTLDPETRARIPKLVRGYKSLLRGLLSHIDGAAKHVSSPNDVDWVRRGLAAASLLDCQEDFRDIYTSLGRLYLAATRCSIDASHWFKEAAELSSTEPNPLIFNKSTREFLSDFEQSSFFKSAIANEVERIKQGLNNNSR